MNNPPLELVGSNRLRTCGGTVRHRTERAGKGSPGKPSARDGLAAESHRISGPAQKAIASNWIAHTSGTLVRYWTENQPTIASLLLRESDGSAGQTDGEWMPTIIFGFHCFIARSEGKRRQECGRKSDSLRMTSLRIRPIASRIKNQFLTRVGQIDDRIENTSRIIFVQLRVIDAVPRCLCPL